MPTTDDNENKHNNVEAREQNRRDMVLPPGIVRSVNSSPVTPRPAPPRSGEGSLSNVSGVPNEAVADSGGSLEVPELPSPLRGGAGRGVTGRGVITAIEPQQKHKNRVNVFIDGTFAAGLFDTVAHDLGIRVGQAITPERLDEIARAETLRRAKEDAYHLLSFRARSEKEIADRLTQKGYEADVIALVNESLQTIGLVDDQAFAQNWVSARGKTRGNRMLAHELRQKGVAGDLAAQTLQERGETDAEHNAAYQAAVKKVGEKPLDLSREARAKIAAHLARRGFGWDIVKPVLAQLYDRTDDAEDGAENPE